jgi:HSP20 family protein
MHRHYNMADDTAYAKRPSSHRHGFNPFTGMQRAPVSIYKTENTYEVLVFAPGRVKENFSVNVKGDEIIISYRPTEDTSSLDWVRKEYSRGGFQRSFFIDDKTINTENIAAKYEDGVLKLSLSFKPGSEPVIKDIQVN